MNKYCDCGSDKFITADSILLMLQPDSEPYENGVKEDLTDEDADYLDQSDVELNISICRKCKKHFYFFDGEEYIKKKNSF